MGKTNTVLLIGNLGKDIEMKHFDNGGCIGRTSLATEEKYKNKATGETVADTEWHNIVFSGKGAEIAEKYLKKGSKIAVTGRIKYRSWDAQDGTKRYMTEIKVREFEFLDSKPEGTQDATRNSGSAVDAYENKPPTTSDLKEKREAEQQGSDMRTDNEAHDESDLPF